MFHLLKFFNSHKNQIFSNQSEVYFLIKKISKKIKNSNTNVPLKQFESIILFISNSFPIHDHGTNVKIPSFLKMN
jgi:hypothetical protein